MFASSQHLKRRTITVLVGMVLASWVGQFIADLGRVAIGSRRATTA